MSPASCSLLVLEDEPAILALVTAALESAGFHQIATASTIASARAEWRAGHGNFDLFLTDFSLPDGSATQFIDELLAQKPGLRVLLMSGFSEEMLGLSATTAPRVTLVPKPFRPSDLRNVVSAEIEPLLRA